MSAEPIARIDDPRVAVFRNVRDRDLRRDGHFIAEGRLVVRALLENSLYETDAVLVTPTAYAAMQEVLADRRRVYLAPQEVMNAIVGFDIHRGCLAAGVRAPERDLHAALAGTPAGLFLVLEDLTNHDNVGALFRSAAAFGAAGVIMTRRTCDPLYRKAIRVSMGTVLRMHSYVVDDISTALEALHVHDFVTVALTPGGDSVPLANVPPRPRLALLLGEEGPGLSKAALDGASVRARIDIRPDVDSLNVAAAAAIALYALSTAHTGLP